MPKHALALKKNRGGTLCGGSKTSDKEDTPTPLWDCPFQAVHSDILSVQHSPGDAIPAFDQRPDDGTKIPSSVA
jgi:hypothetical protein